MSFQESNQKQQSNSSSQLQCKDLSDWQIILQASFSTKNNDSEIIQLSSQGKWTLQIKRKNSILNQNKMLQLIRNDFGLDQEDLQVEIKNQVNNVKQLLELIRVKLSIDKNEFKQKYHFWEVQNCRIVVKDGNTQIIDFVAKDFTYVVFYQTTYKNN